MSNVFFTLEGDSHKPVMVLGHPLGMNRRVWDPLMPTLLTHFRVARWDLPGHGLSDPLADDALPVEEMALVNQLLDKCDEFGIERFHYVGTSIGGVIGQQLLRSHPERLIKATLTNTGAKIGTKEAWLTRQQDVASLGLESMASAIVARWFSEHSVQQQASLSKDWQHALAKVDGNSYGALCAWLGEIDLKTSLGVSQVPVQLVCGEQDMATTPDLMRDLATLFVLPTVTILPEVGHVPSLEAPKALVDLLLTFHNKK